MTAVLISHFLFDLHRSDHTANIPSSPSAIPSLNIAGGVQEDHGTLPAFIASMGSRINAGLHFVDSPDADEDMAPWHTTNEGASPEEGSPPGDDEIAVAPGTPVEQEESVRLQSTYDKTPHTRKPPRSACRVPVHAPGAPSTPII